MSEAIRFLHMMAQALSTMVLYSPGHPATKRSIEGAWQALFALLQVDPRPVFFFIGTAPVYSSRALHELRDWPYARRLTDSGVQRLEFDTAATEESLTEFFNRLTVRLTTGAIPFEESQHPLPGIIFGSVAVEEAVTVEGAATEVGGETHLQLSVDLSDEIEAIGYVLEEGRRGAVARAEVEAVTRILAGLLDRHDAPQVSFSDDVTRYAKVHPINTALLAMAGARAVGVDPRGLHRIGVAALFHDIGMTRLPSGLGDRSSLTPEARALIETHPAEGARLLLDDGGRGLELAAVVAFEHQIRPDGGGYPARRFRSMPHWASRLIGTAAAFVAVRAPRPYRPAWPIDRALRALEEGAGTVFDGEASRLLAGVLREG